MDAASLAHQSSVGNLSCIWKTFYSDLEVKGASVLGVCRLTGLLVSPPEICASNPSLQMRTYLANLLFIASRAREINSEHEDICKGMKAI